MFKSVFAKYIVTFIMIILVSFTVISLLITSVINGYSEDAKMETMKNTADISAQFIYDQLLGEEYSTISDVICAENQNIKNILKSASSTSGDMTLLITDTDGNVLYSEGSEKEEIVDGANIPKELMDDLVGENHVSKDRQLGNVFNSPKYIYAEPVHSADGTVCGAVFICASSAMLEDLLEEIINSIVINVKNATLIISGIKYGNAI